jgi:hypothetical protein
MTKKTNNEPHAKAAWMAEKWQPYGRSQYRATVRRHDA